MAFRITDWEKYYENNRTRELKRMAWVPMPNKFDGDGYTMLLNHPNGAAHFGAWCALVEVASRCDTRGVLLRNACIAHDAESLSRITRIPVTIWEEVLPRLIAIGWITDCEIPQEGAVSSQEGATAPHPSANERNGKNGKNGTECGTVPLSPPAEKQTYGENVTMTPKQYQALVDKYGSEATGRAVAKLSTYKLAKGRQYKSDYHAILQWVIEAIGAKPRAGPASGGGWKCPYADCGHWNAHTDSRCLRCKRDRDDAPPA